MTRFKMEPGIVNMKSATKRNWKALDCALSAIVKYNTAVAKAAATLSADIQKCKAQLDDSVSTKSNRKK